MIFSFAWDLCKHSSRFVFDRSSDYKNFLSDNKLFHISLLCHEIFLLKIVFSFPDLLTVSETAAEPPQDEGSSLNSPRNLALEATFINHNFSQQVLKGNVYLGIS